MKQECYPLDCDTWYYFVQCHFPTPDGLSVVQEVTSRARVFVCRIA
jgi:hypothetical protein